MSTRVAVPSRGRLREDVLALLDQAGYASAPLRGVGARVALDGVELVEMRPRDAAAWLAAGRVQAAFLSTDIVLEEGLGQLPALPLGVSRSALVVASRDDDGREGPEQLAGCVVATHLPRATADWFQGRGVPVTVVAMGGALEGVCAAGMADAIVDLRETGTSLSQNRLRVLAEIVRCEALFVQREEGGPAGLAAMAVRLQAALEARLHRYVTLHLPPDRLGALMELFPGLASPTVLPLAGREDLVAVHLVVDAGDFWGRLAELRAAGATGIVALPPSALLR